MLEFRNLKKEEIEVRVGVATEDGVSLLLYKNARVDMAILDETVGPERWQREHYDCKGNLFCKIGISFDGNWVWKSDCGSESNTEAEKGEASDSFKRAGTNWGIGRELYTAPFLWVDKENVRLKSKDKNGKKQYSTKDKFSVADITIVDKKIVALTIRNDSMRRIVIQFGSSEGFVILPNWEGVVAAAEIDKAQVIEQLKKSIDLTAQEISNVIKQPINKVKKMATIQTGVSGADSKELTQISVYMSQWLNQVTKEEGSN